ncbi:MAG: F0F1 ATP synthase subunit gamma [Maricaulaceae bacterium]|jgi:F-type H+-transporting ATPase subunit gamma
MPSLKDFRNRIDSVKSTQKITKAKQMVAAAKLRKAQEAASAAQPYATRMAAVVANLSAGMADRPGAPLLLVGRGEIKTHLLIVATADRGLCGGFNTNIVRKARERIVELEREGQTVKILCVGRKAYDMLKNLHKDKIVGSFSFKELKMITSKEAGDVADDARTLFENGEVDAVSIVYSVFKNVITQVPTVQTLLPASMSIDPEVKGPDLQGAAYEYEPDEEEILAVLLPRNLTTQIFNAMLQNAAGEQGASMTAMDNATRNAGELIDKLTLQYNRLRQANITKELIEIISGAEAL